MNNSERADDGLWECVRIKGCESATGDIRGFAVDITAALIASRHNITLPHHLGNII